MVVCEFCKQTFTTKGNKERHQRTTKFCMAIQEKQNRKTIQHDLFACEYCEKELSSKNRLLYHLNICKMKPKTEKGTLPITPTPNIMNNQSHNTTIQSNNENSFNTNTNNISIINYMTPDRVITTFEEKYTLEDLMGSQKALAEFTNQHFLNGTDKAFYLCIDRSRKKFVYHDDEKEVEDKNAQLLMLMVSIGFDTITEIYKNKLSELEKKLELFQKEDATAMIQEMHIQIRNLKNTYKETMSMRKNGDSYRTQLSHILPNTVEQLDEEKRFLEMEEKYRLLQEKMTNDRIEKDNLAISVQDKKSETKMNDEWKELIETIKENPNKLFPIIKNENGIRTIGGISCGKLGIYRNKFRKDGTILIPKTISDNKESLEEFLYWIHEKYTE